MNPFAALCIARLAAATIGHDLPCQINDRSLAPQHMLSIRAESDIGWRTAGRLWVSLPRTAPLPAERPRNAPIVRIASVRVSGRGYEHVKRAALKHGVPVNLALRVARQESGGRCNARSKAGAMGLMQVMPGTARKHGVKNARLLYDCKIGAETGVKELKHLLNITNGDVRQTLVAYNAGESYIGKRRIPRETRHYVRAILGE